MVHGDTGACHGEWRRLRQPGELRFRIVLAVLLAVIVWIVWAIAMQS
jgi:hypothetical protein